MPYRILKKAVSLASKLKASSGTKPQRCTQRARPASYPIIFLHIPKTAGTSFRIAAKAYYGANKILKDYGADSTVTSPQIKEHYYNNNNIQKLRVVAKKYELITGHYPVAKYKDVFDGAPIVTFLRNPVERVISEYYHLCSSIGLTLSLREFYRKEVYQNRQTKLLEGASFKDFDFVGVTDLYELSLSLFNQKFGTSLEYLNMNRGTYREDITASVSKAEIDEIIKLNQSDIELYQSARCHLLSAKNGNEPYDDELAVLNH